MISLTNSPRTRVTTLRLNTKWQQDEQWLWDQFMQPVTPKVRLHGLNPEQRKNALLEIEKQKKNIFANQWRYYGLFIRH